MRYIGAVSLYLLIMLLAVLLGAAAVALTQRLLPVERRKPHTSAMGDLEGGLRIMFGVIVGFTSFLVLSEYNTARATVEAEAADVAQIYELAQQLPESKREEIQGLAESYARVVVEEEWPLMSQGQTSPRAQALADELRSAIHEFRPSGSIERTFHAQELVAVNNLHKDRAARLLDLQQRLPPILWIALFGLSIIVVIFACLVGIEDTRLHMFGVSTLAAGITLVFLTIYILDRPFGTEFRVGPQPFELVVHEIEATGQQ